MKASIALCVALKILARMGRFAARNTLGIPARVGSFEAFMLLPRELRQVGRLEARVGLVFAGMNYLLVLAAALVASTHFETPWTLAWYFAVFSISVLAMGAFFFAVTMAGSFLACGVMLWASVREALRAEWARCEQQAISYHR